MAGRVVDESGRPVVGVSVVASAPELVMGRLRLTALGGSTRTDDRGEYRIHGLLPDVYHVFAVPAPFATQRSPVDEPVGHVLTFHGSALTPESAAQVPISEARESAGVDIQLQSADTRALVGVLSSHEGRRLSNWPVMLFPGEDMTVPVSADQRTSPEGTFTFERLPHGTYVIQTGAVDDANRPLFASQVVHVDSRQKDVSLVAFPGSRVTGTVVFEPPSRSVRADELALTARPADLARSPVGPHGAHLAVREDFRFELADVWGPQVLDVLASPKGWMLKRVEADGLDSTDTPIDVAALRPGVDRLRVTFTNRLSGVTGRVYDSEGGPVALAAVVAFSADPSCWDATSTRVRRASSDVNGAFAIPRLPPGDYHLVAVGHLPDHRWRRLDVLHALRSQASRLVIREGRESTATLRLQQFEP